MQIAEKTPLVDTALIQENRRLALENEQLREQLLHYRRSAKERYARGIASNRKKSEDFGELVLAACVVLVMYVAIYVVHGLYIWLTGMGVVL